MSEEQMLADLALRGWRPRGDYLYRRISEVYVAVSIRSVIRDGYYASKIPFTPHEERIEQGVDGWTEGAVALTECREAALKYDAEHES